MKIRPTEKIGHRRAFTLTELIIVIVILAILVVISIPIINGVRTRMTEATCISRMKRIYYALDSYVKDNDGWPQQPQEITRLTEVTEWWYYTLEPYGISKQDWLCPIHEFLLRQQGEQPEFSASYVPTTFDSRRLTPYRWQQPWVMEHGNFHKKGSHLVMPDGSIHRIGELRGGSIPDPGGN